VNELRDVDGDIARRPAPYRRQYRTTRSDFHSDEVSPSPLPPESEEGAPTAWELVGHQLIDDEDRWILLWFWAKAL